MFRNPPVCLLGILLLGHAHMTADAQTAPSPPASQEAVVPEDPVTPEIAASAVAAVNRLGEEVVLGRYQVTLDRMNPEWKKRAAQLGGGMQALERKIESVPAQMVKLGISMLSFKPQGEPIVYQVDAGNRMRTQDGVTVKDYGYKKWLVLVPTATRFRVLQRSPGAPPRTLTIEKTGFQAAISEKDRLDWTFIDGSGLTAGDLRGIFPTLPLDMKLPAISEKEIR